jgi:hypothetical protein
MQFDTKIAVALRADLPTWQKLNMTAFLVSGIAAETPDVIGADYEDASGNQYLPMFVQPVMIFAATAQQLRQVYEYLAQKEVRFSIFTQELFSTGHDEANRAAVRAVPAEALDLTGLAVRARKKIVDNAFKGLSLHP